MQFLIHALFVHLHIFKSANLFYHNSESVETACFLDRFPTFRIYGTGGHLGVDLCEVLGQTARLFGLLDTSSGLLMELCLRADDREGAAKQFARYVDTFTGPAVLPDEDLFRPGMEYTRTEGQLASTREMRRMLLKAVDEDVRFGPLRDNPVFAAALQKLKDSLS